MKSIFSEFLKNFYNFAQDIKIVHSVFSLPFAACAILISGTESLNLSKVAWIFLAVISARSFAMGMNRYLDRDIDSLNPRTQQRKIPSGKLSPRSSLACSLLFGLIFMVAAFQLNTLSGWCSFIVLAFLGSYPYLKRFSWFAHGYLGLCLGMVPPAVGIALSTGPSSLFCLSILGLGVALWVAGFDMLYALQDLDFDRTQGLQSVPVRFGVKKSLYISRICFLGMLVCLAIVGVQQNLGALFYLGLAFVALILTYEHWLVRDSRDGYVSRHIGFAFFNANGLVSVIFYLFTQLSYL
ncbi:MAG: putative 4-hydroxybenzoate polyprenyltransferase [Oligoflexales bacterium]|nr:putative 4-hydroxybenzoate polyprenyltransferase [Oligoflexales bacterium]